MTEASTLPADTEDGNAQTRLMPQGRDVAIGGSPLLFYAVGRDKLVSVSPEGAAHFIEECRLMETVVEEYQHALDELSAATSSYIALMMSDIRDQQFVMDRESLRQQVLTAQRKVDEKNRALKDVIEPLTELSSETNKVMELIPIQRRASRTEHFRLVYARSHIIRAISEEIPLSGGSGNASQTVLTNGRVDTDKLVRQMVNVSGEAKLKADFPWFEDWLKKEKETVDLFKWSEAINENLSAKYEILEGEERDKDSSRVELSAEAQLMRWTSGASGMSGEFNPFQGKASLKADAKAELVLAEAKASLDFYTPAGGLMLACELPNEAGIIDLGMIRSHAFITCSGGIGASVAAELSLNVDMRDGQLQTRGVQGQLAQRGLPGEQRSVVRQSGAPQLDNSEVAGGMAAFAGGQAIATFGVQLEWKNPEEGNKFKPFAKSAPSAVGMLGIGAAANFSVYYDNGKFRISAQAGVCCGIGLKGKIDFEVDAGLIYEFAKWVVYQLKNIDYSRLFFINEDAFYVLSNVIAIMVAEGGDIADYLADTADVVEKLASEVFSELSSNAENAYKRSDLAERINENPDLLRYATPDTKGLIIYWLMQTNIFDVYHPLNRDVEGWWENPSLFGFMNERKTAIMHVLHLVQSKSEMRNVMRRITPKVGEIIDSRTGEEMVSCFLARGERELPPPLSSHFERAFVYLRASLIRDASSVGTEIVRNDDLKYRLQEDVSRYFNTPCENETQCILEIDVLSEE
ncbi:MULTISPECIES: hypothetical protein [Halomonas]|uniref:hypothetical protein n=1 Tax=Halomonas TaxID=2745 RepID=UPI001C9615F4|nr:MULTISPECIES: hypothetical protein [Halomonas]MBY6206509.1 hypothetical protein [Halomonas sp. DP3Y7-2]MBY6227600.1 hypothetical protein [Halomonas sp. DP3Y7-1]MCA0915665.1 hypothetical protein [Halomonas denitrificans]